MIKIEEIQLSEKHLGMQVIYVPVHAKGDVNHRDSEIGCITSFNDSYAFVRYGSNVGSQATRPEDLIWALYTPEP